MSNLCYILIMALIRFTKPTLTRKDMDAVLQTMVDEKIGPGDRRREFVRLFSTYINSKDGLALRTFTDAFEIALKTVGLESGDTVVLSIYSPEVYEVVFRKLGLKTSLVDVDKLGLPDVDKVKEAIENENAKAFVLFEPLGQIYDDPERYRELGIPLIEDISESLGSTFGDEVKAGMVGDIVISSFEEEGVISTGGGAAVVTRNAEYIELMKKAVEKSSHYIEMADLNAALGIVQLVKLDSTLKRRNEIYRAFLQALNQGDGHLFLSGNIDFKTNGIAFPVVVNTKTMDAINFAKKYGVTVRKSFSSAIGSRYQDKFERFPNACAALSRCLSFPIYPFLKSMDVDTIQKVLRHIG